MFSKMKRAKSKHFPENKRSKRGFTLIELLTATLILLLVSLTAAGGLQMMGRAYEKTVLKFHGSALLNGYEKEIRKQLENAIPEGGAMENPVFGSEWMQARGRLTVKPLPSAGQIIVFQKESGEDQHLLGAEYHRIRQGDLIVPKLRYQYKNDRYEVELSAYAKGECLEKRVFSVTPIKNFK